MEGRPADRFVLDIAVNTILPTEQLQTNFVFLQPSAGRAKRKVAQPASPGPVLYALCDYSVFLNGFICNHKSHV